jgi:hypothetical protein
VHPVGIAVKQFNRNPNGMRGEKKREAIFRRKIVSARAGMEHRKMLQYLPVFELPHGNAAFGERRLPEIAPIK